VIISFDMDSTLADTQHRWHLINEEDRAATDWDAYSMACADDSVGPAYLLAMTMLRLGASIVVCSARSKCADQLTRKWLNQRDIRPLAMTLYDESEHGTDYKTNAISHSEWKAEALLKLNQFCIKRCGEEITMHVDDQFKVKEVVEAKTGIPVLVVHPGFEGFVA
jgi:hypothetical protein